MPMLITCKYVTSVDGISLLLYLFNYNTQLTTVINGFQSKLSIYELKLNCKHIPSPDSLILNSSLQYLFNHTRLQ